MLPALRSSLWSPARQFDAPFGTLWTDVDRWLSRVFHETPRFEFAFEPSLDVEEDDNEVRVRAEIPGVDAKDLHVELREGILTISGEKKDEHEDNGHGRHWTERSYGSFARTIALPRHVDGEEIHASYKDGILTVALPKTEQAKPKHIKVNVG